MSTPDRTPEQPEPDTRQGPQTPLEKEGWGTTEPANPFTEEARTIPWFRRPATLIGGAAVAVVVIVGLVIALVATGKDADSTEAGSAAATTTSSAAAFSDASDELTYADQQFLRGISPSIRRYATDEELLDQADYICTSLNGTQTDQQLAMLMTAMDVAEWASIEAPQIEGDGYTLDEELLNLTVNFMTKSESAYCPGSWPNASSDLLS